jgi:WD40 repeat protein
MIYIATRYLGFLTVFDTLKLPPSFRHVKNMLKTCQKLAMSKTRCQKLLSFSRNTNFHATSRNKLRNKLEFNLCCPGSKLDYSLRWITQFLSVFPATTLAMDSASKRPSVAVANMTLEPMMILEGHEALVRSMHYFPDGKRMISGSYDKTTRQWDMQTGQEIEKARDVCEWKVGAVAVSRDGRWVVTADRDGYLKACEIETGIAKTFQGHSQWISCIDICADGTLFASGSDDQTTRIWSLKSLNTGKLVAGPFESPDWVGSVRFSRDSKKLAVHSDAGRCLEVWNVQTQKLDKRVGESGDGDYSWAPVFWTIKETILAVFGFIPEEPLTTIYEFDASTLETVGAPFNGHTKVISDLALSFDGALVASTSYNDTIKLWAFESREILASFHVQLRSPLILSPDSRRLIYASGSNIYVCNIPPDILTSLGSATTGRPKVRLHPSPTFHVITFSRRPVQPLSIYWMYALRSLSRPCG